MKKLIAICAVALSMGAFADSYLYWMLDESSELSWTGSDKTTTISAPTYNQVAFAVVDSSGNKVSDSYLSLYNLNGTAQTSPASVTAASGAALFANLGNYASSSYSYYIELLNDSSVVGRSSESLSYSAASKYIQSAIGGTSQMSAQAWAPTSFTATAAIPEPTSGLLMLVGLAGLALRRKRMAKKAYAIHRPQAEFSAFRITRRVPTRRVFFLCLRRLTRRTKRCG